MFTRYTSVILALASSACGMPRDVEGTIDAIETGKVIRVGLVGNGDHISGEDDQLARRLISRLESRTGAKAQVLRGAAEPLLLDLEAGELDLVVGSFDAKTPWMKRVSFAPALADRPRGRGSIELKAAGRNGESRWVSLIERESRSLAKESGHQ